jgi:hypothetical protein
MKSLLSMHNTHLLQNKTVLLIHTKEFQYLKEQLMQIKKEFTTGY